MTLQSTFCFVHQRTVETTTVGRMLKQSKSTKLGKVQQHNKVCIVIVVYSGCNILYTFSSAEEITYLSAYICLLFCLSRTIQKLWTNVREILGSKKIGKIYGLICDGDFEYVVLPETLMVFAFWRTYLYC